MGQQDLPLASKIKHLGSVIPERHANTANGVENLEAVDGLSGVSHIPETELSITHARETGGGDSVVLAHPDGPAVLCSSVSRYLVGGLLLPHVPEPDLLVAAGGDHHTAVSGPR